MTLSAHTLKAPLKNRSSESVNVGRFRPLLLELFETLKPPVVPAVIAPGPCGIHNAPSPSHFTLYKERQGYGRADGQDVVHQLSLAWAAKFP